MLVLELFLLFGLVGTIGCCLRAGYLFYRDKRLLESRVICQQDQIAQLMQRVECLEVSSRENRCIHRIASKAEKLVRLNDARLACAYFSKWQAWQRGQHLEAETRTKQREQGNREESLPSSGTQLSTSRPLADEPTENQLPHESQEADVSSLAVYHGSQIYAANPVPGPQSANASSRAIGDNHARTIATSQFLPKLAIPPPPPSPGRPPARHTASADRSIRAQARLSPATLVGNRSPPRRPRQQDRQHCTNQNRAFSHRGGFHDASSGHRSGLPLPVAPELRAVGLLSPPPRHYVEPILVTVDCDDDTITMSPSQQGSPFTHTGFSYQLEDSPSVNASPAMLGRASTSAYSAFKAPPHKVHHREALRDRNFDHDTTIVMCDDDSPAHPPWEDRR
eukprot:NODE_1632_length_1464_cov_32.484099_g1474_i0.p1 GENE.NODE_1632_length_1464_cov_32.484099_g1474_i0~~NODE_1632_length_1464_cov_32.484099_g1474_i0.p1  ORF type:complete len:394 (+),score=44.06 NODE_1632_length_1464_cov_32.484099_g1474_i0:79-1260(+)